MNIRQRKRIKQKLQIGLFCTVLLWMLISAVADSTVIALRTQATPNIFSDYARVEIYQGYAYALDGIQKKEAIASQGNGKWKLLCTAPNHMSGLDLVQNCGVPIATARHLSILSHQGIAHDIVMAEK